MSLSIYLTIAVIVFIAIAVIVVYTEKFPNDFYFNSDNIDDVSSLLELGIFGGLFWPVSIIFGSLFFALKLVIKYVNDFKKNRQRK